jgi:phage gp36-like protein
MNYCVVSDLYKHGCSSELLEGLSSDDITAVITARSRFCDGYLAACLVLPVTVVGQDLTMCCAQLSVFDVLVHLKRFTPETQDYEVFKGQFEQAMRWLEGVAGGKIKPQSTGTDPVPVGTAGTFCAISQQASRGY